MTAREVKARQDCWLDEEDRARHYVGVIAASVYNAQGPKKPIQPDDVLPPLRGRRPRINSDPLAIMRDLEMLADEQEARQR